LPFHNTLQVADDVAVLDNISGGRVDLPVGVGLAPEEFRTFGVALGRVRTRWVRAATAARKARGNGFQASAAKWCSLARTSSKPSRSASTAFSR
jgi:Luciferase-like monooxygenase